MFAWATLVLYCATWTGPPSKSARLLRGCQLSRQRPGRSYAGASSQFPYRRNHHVANGGTVEEVMQVQGLKNALGNERTNVETFERFTTL